MVQMKFVVFLEGILQGKLKYNVYFITFLFILLFGSVISTYNMSFIT